MHNEYNKDFIAQIFSASPQTICRSNDLKTEPNDRWVQSFCSIIKYRKISKNYI